MNRRGFTLIELLVSLAVMTVLGTIVISAISRSRIGTRDVRRIADLRQLQVALEGYYDLNTVYPAVNAGHDAQALSSALIPRFLRSLPSDPLDPSWSTPLRDYLYCTDGSQKGYTLMATLERTTAYCKISTGNNDTCGWNGNSSIPVCDTN